VIGISTDLLTLARRLEMTEALAGVEYAATLRRTGANPDATSLAVGGGYATFAGAGSPISQAFALGLHGALPAVELDRLEAFFRAHGTASAIELCPLADASLARALLARGYQVVEQSDVLVRGLADALEVTDPGPGVAVRRAMPGEIARLARVVAEGFIEDEAEIPGLAAVLEGMFRMSTGTVFAAECDGTLAGGALLTIHRRIGVLCGAATLPAARGRGIHRALLDARLGALKAMRCETAMVASRPETTAHRNAERAGFAVAYGRSRYVLPVPAVAS
jgi:ribosomal protein S18 acetylase RimI-like enzyme